MKGDDRKRRIRIQYSELYEKITKSRSYDYDDIDENDDEILRERITKDVQ